MIPQLVCQRHNAIRPVGINRPDCCSIGYLRDELKERRRPVVQALFVEKTGKGWSGRDNAMIGSGHLMQVPSKSRTGTRNHALHEALSQGLRRRVAPYAYDCTCGFGIRKSVACGHADGQREGGDQDKHYEPATAPRIRKACHQRVRTPTDFEHNTRYSPRASAVPGPV